MNPNSAQQNRWKPGSWAWLISLAMFGWILISSPNFGGHSDQIGSPIAGDFLQEWIGGYLIRVHGPQALFDMELVKSVQHDQELLGFRWNENEFFAMVYPPFYYLIWVPLTFLPYQWGAWLFVIAMIGCFFLSHILLVRMMPRGPNEKYFPGLASWLLLSTVFFVPLIRSITTGQKGTLCLLIFTATLYCLERRRNFGAGLTFGLMAFKPQLAVVVGISQVLRGNYRFVAGSVAVVATLVLTCLAMGPSVCWEYIQFGLGADRYVETSGYDLYKSHCLYGFLALLSGGKTSIWIKVAWLALSGMVVGLLIRMYRNSRTIPVAARPALQSSSLVVATLLLSPHLFSYDLVLLLIPFYMLGGLSTAGLLQPGRQRSFAILLLVLFVASGFSHVFAATLGIQVTTIAMFGLLWLLAATTSRDFLSQASAEAGRLAPGTDDPIHSGSSTAPVGAS